MTRLARLAGRAAAALMMVAGCGSESRAQESLTGVLSFLLTNQSVPTGDFEKDAEAARVTRDTLTRLLIVDLATVPISSSSSGFVYRFDPALGTMTRASNSFGPFFTERSLTAGRGQASLGVSAQVARFTSLDGRDLRDGRLLTSGNQFRDEAAPFDVETLTLEIESRTVTFFGNIGLTDRLDVGVALPLVTLSLRGERINTYRGQTLLQATATADATGLADAAVRAKVRLFGAADRGLSAVGEVRLPTGREEDLLGTGETAWRGVVIGSLQGGRAAVHGNLGLSGGGLVRETQYRGAATLEATPRLTLVGEIIGRRVAGVGPLSVAYAPHPTIVGVDTLRLVAEDGNTWTAATVVGAKWNISGTLLVSGNVRFPLTNNGLKSRPVVLVGLDVAVAR
jgi:hypothetical protein